MKIQLILREIEAFQAFFFLPKGYFPTTWEEKAELLCSALTINHSGKIEFFTCEILRNWLILFSMTPGKIKIMHKPISFLLSLCWIFSQTIAQDSHFLSREGQSIALFENTSSLCLYFHDPVQRLSLIHI